MTLMEKREALKQVNINPGFLSGLDELVKNIENNNKFEVLLRNWLDSKKLSNVCPHYILLVNLLYKHYFEGQKRQKS